MVDELSSASGEGPELLGFGAGWVRVVELTVFAVWLIMISLAAYAHEQWFDEAQAWLLARDASWVELFRDLLRYEGHPPLWYLILSVPAKLGLPFSSMKVVAVLSATVGAWLLIFRSDRVPLPLRLLTPFAYFVAYQYSVVARSYILLFPLFVLVVMLYPVRRKHLLGFTVVLLLMANVSAHSFLFAWVLFGLLLFDLRRELLDQENARLRRAAVISVMLMVLNALLLAVVLKTPDDIMIASRLDWSFPRAISSGLMSYAGALFGRNILSVVALGLLLVWFHVSGVLREFLLLTAALIAIFGIYWSRWHEGLAGYVLFFAILLSFLRHAGARTAWRSGLRRAGIVVGCLIMLQHLWWTLAATRNEIEGVYTGGVAAAEFLQGVDPAVTIYGAGFNSLVVQPWFEENIFDNYEAPSDGAFWDWSLGNRWPYTALEPDPEELVEWIDQSASEHPDLILVSMKFEEERQFFFERLLQNPDYELIGGFHGQHFWKDGITEADSYALFGRRKTEDSE